MNMQGETDACKKADLQDQWLQFGIDGMVEEHSSGAASRSTATAIRSRTGSSAPEGGTTRRRLPQPLPGREHTGLLRF